MNNIESVWIMLSDDCTACCNEPDAPTTCGDVMTLDLFCQIMKLAAQNGWKCKVLTNKQGLPEGFESLAAAVNAEFIMPVESEACDSNRNSTLALATTQGGMLKRHGQTDKCILRVNCEGLRQLSNVVTSMLQHTHDVSIKHPELRQYRSEDIIVYSEQLREVAQWLLTQGQSWTRYRIDCLTDRFHSDSVQECGAGMRRLAIGPKGDLYICPAAAKSSLPTCGHILDELMLPNRQLYTRKYSVPCTQCDALHCTRCVYHSKLSTHEFGVPARNVCLLANYEQEVQAWFAGEATKRGLWDERLRTPKPPVAYDPFELVKTEDDVPVVYSWHRLLSFDGNLKNLSPAMMLDMIHGLHGWCTAVAACAEAGSAPSRDDLERDVLSSLRRCAIERYRDVAVQERGPTIREIEILMSMLPGV